MKPLMQRMDWSKPIVTHPQLRIRIIQSVMAIHTAVAALEARRGAVGDRAEPVLAKCPILLFSDKI